MFTYDLSDKLRKKVRKLAKKDRILALIFKRKIAEVVGKDIETINIYKNLKSPHNEFKRIHLTSRFILLFKVDINKKDILFVDIIHWDRAYK